MAISLTNCYRQTDFGDPIVALKSYVLSPFADENRMQSIVEPRRRGAAAVDRDDSGSETRDPIGLPGDLLIREPRRLLAAIARASGRSTLSAT